MNRNNEEEKDLFIPAELYLRGYSNVFNLIDWNCKEELDDSDEDYPINATTFIATYYDRINNNTLHLEEIRYECEKCEDIDVVVNAISNEAYMYLMNELSSHKNVTVFWSQVYGTTSDYVIVYDIYGKDCLYDENYLKEIMKKEIGYKYRFVKNGKINRINPEMMGR